MSDFLSQLAARALALPPVIRPRLQSIYETAGPFVLPDSLEEQIESPAAPRLGDSLEEPARAPSGPPRTIEFAHQQGSQLRDEKSGSSEAGEGVEREPAPPRKPKVVPQSSLEKPVVSKPDARSLSPDEIESAGQIKTTERKTPAHQMAREDEGRLEPVRNVQVRRPVVARADAAALAGVRSLENELETPASTKQKELVPPETFAEPRPRVEEWAMQSPRAEEDAEPPARKPATQPAIVTIQSAQRAREERAAPSFSPRLAPRAEGPRVSAPSVQVTIGRVEIRAVMPPPPEQPPAPASSSPKLSLDEYLKRNAGASR